MKRQREGMSVQSAECEGEGNARERAGACNAMRRVRKSRKSQTVHSALKVVLQPGPTDPFSHSLPSPRPGPFSVFRWAQSPVFDQLIAHIHPENRRRVRIRPEINIFHGKSSTQPRARKGLGYELYLQIYEEFVQFSEFR